MTTSLRTAVGLVLALGLAGCITPTVTGGDTTARLPTEGGTVARGVEQR